MSQLTLVIVEGQDAGREFPLTEAIIVGRDRAADVVICDHEVSSRHASFAPGDGGVAVEDLGSTNGTYVNGQRITGSQQLGSGDQVQMGKTLVEIRGLAPAPAAASPTEAAQPAALEVTRQRSIPMLPLLVFLEGEKAGSEVPVGGPTVLGRDAGVADVILERDTEVSRRHLTFAPAGAGLTVQDLDSSNGTFVNGQRITGAVTLSAGNQVRLGETVIEVRLSINTVVQPPAAAPAPAAASAGASNGIEVELVEGVRRPAGGRRGKPGRHPG